MKNNTISFSNKKSSRRVGSAGHYRMEFLEVPSSSGPLEPGKDDRPSGDWVAAARREPDCLSVVLADLEGKGHQARPFHEILDRHLRKPEAPLPWLSSLNADWHEGRFATVAVAEVNVVQHEFQVALAGHPAPLMRFKGGGTSFVPALRLWAIGLNLGEWDGEPMPQPFPPGAALVVVSDGVLDAGVLKRGEAFGAERLRAAIASAPTTARIATHILNAVSRHLEGTVPEDDLTVAVIARPKISALAIPVSRLRAA